MPTWMFGPYEGFVRECVGFWFHAFTAPAVWAAHLVPEVQAAKAGRRG